MNTNELVACIDAELTRLTKARNLLLGGSGTEGGRTFRVRIAAKRTLSTEARKRISEAQKKALGQDQKGCEVTRTLPTA
jgi:hypothetical protein